MTLVHRRAGEDVPGSNETTISHHQCVRQHDFFGYGNSSAKTSTTHTHEDWHYRSISQQVGGLVDPPHLQGDHLAPDAGQQVATGWLYSGKQSANQNGQKQLQSQNQHSKSKAPKWKLWQESEDTFGQGIEAFQFLL